MRILLTGGSGFIGSFLYKEFKELGHDIIIVSRKQHTSNHFITWDDLKTYKDKVDIIINLAGENISSKRWSTKQKEKIVSSRIITTENIISYIKNAKTKPRLLINGSAIGIYGTSETNTFDENSSYTGNDFLATTVNKWEETASQASVLGVRTVYARFGVVLDKNGGALKKMLLPYYFYVGGKIGTGNQWVSWITLQDVFGLMQHIINNDIIEGPVNFTTPEPIRMKELSANIASVLHKPNFFSIPSFAIRLLFGEMSMVLLDGQNVIPFVAEKSEYQYKFPTLPSAIHHVLS